MVAGWNHSPKQGVQGCGGGQSSKALSAHFAQTQALSFAASGNDSSSSGVNTASNTPATFQRPACGLGDLHSANVCASTKRADGGVYSVHKGILPLVCLWSQITPPKRLNRLKTGHHQESGSPTANLPTQARWSQQKLDAT